jgi:hypothetical protein
LRPFFSARRHAFSYCASSRASKSARAAESTFIFTALCELMCAELSGGQSFAAPDE